MDPQIVFFGSIFFSITSMLFYMVSMFLKSKHKMVGLCIGCDISDILMYLIIGGKTGIVNSAASLCKDAAYSKFDSKKMTVVFAGLKILLLAFNYEGILTLSFIIMQVVITYLLLKGTVQQLRFGYLVNQVIYVIYDYTFANIVVAFITSTLCISLIVSIIKNWHEKPVYT